MEFWGVEVKAGEPLTVKPETGMVIHLSQACLGETKSKGAEPIFLSVKVNDKKFVLGTLSLEQIPQVTFDLVFEKGFELSHNWKHGSIYLCGYQTFAGDQEEDGFDDFDDDSEEEEEDIAPNAIQNGKGGQKLEPAKPDAKTNATKPESSEKPKVKVVEPSKDEEDDSEDSDESEEDDSDDEMVSSGDDSDEDMLGGHSDDDDEDDDDEDSDEEDDEENPKKPEPSKKRANDSAVKTPVPAKKPKAGASPKSDGKKGGHTATPHPAKNAGKASATGDKLKGPQTPKSAGKSGAHISCKSCSKTFASDKALESHTKAKHG